MKLFNILIAASVLLFASASLATTVAATNIRTARGYTYAMCDTQVTAGPHTCEVGSGGSEIYAKVDRFDSMTFTFRQSSDHVSNSCDIYGTDASSDIVNEADLYGEITSDTGFMFGPLNSTSLTDQQQVVTISGIGLHYVAVVCTRGAGNLFVEMSATTSGMPRQ
tara:strand:+ start:1586 stop:2080 length:495 start_codon:yes stop_codon:yes gene_type:complete